MDPLPEAAPWAESAIRSLSRIRDSRQRAVKLSSLLETKNAQDLAEFFCILFSPQTLKRKSHWHRVNLDMLSHRLVLDRLGYEKIAEIYECAAKNGWLHVQLLLRPLRKAKADAEEIPEGFAAKLDRFTLGQRKQMSRNQTRRTLEFLLFDSQPMVIRELLRNPKMTERDVIRICARHQAPPTVLEEVLKSEAWLSHYRVRKALVFNPQTPLAYAVTLLLQLRTEDLRVIVTGGSSRPELIAMAKKILAKKNE